MGLALQIAWPELLVYPVHPYAISPDSIVLYSNQKVEGSRIVWTYDIGVSVLAYIQDKYRGLLYKLHDCKDYGLLIGPLCRHS